MLWISYGEEAMTEANQRKAEDLIAGAKKIFPVVPESELRIVFEATGGLAEQEKFDLIPAIMGPALQDWMCQSLEALNLMSAEICDMTYNEPPIVD